MDDWTPTEISTLALRSTGFRMLAGSSSKTPGDVCHERITGYAVGGKVGAGEPGDPIARANGKSRDYPAQGVQEVGHQFRVKFKANEALIVGFSERLTSVEERLSDLEQR